MGSFHDQRLLRLPHRVLHPAVRIALAAALVLQTGSIARAQQSGEKPQGPPAKSSYDQVAPVLLGKETLRDRIARDIADLPSVMARQTELLGARYDLTSRPDPNVRMSRGKPVQVGPATKLPPEMTWEKLAAMSPADIREKGVFPKGFLPLPHPKHDVGGMIFPQVEIQHLPRLQRFDVTFDIPDHFLPEFPPAMYLTTRPDLGDVSQGKMVTVDNFQELFAGILNAKDLEGMRLLVTQFPQQQFNATADRKTENPLGMQGVSCFDCHVNGHTSAATHLVGDIRPQSHRRRIDTTSLRGVNIQRLFGSQLRAEDRRGLHRVRATRGLLRRRPGVGLGQGRQPARTRQPGPLHGGGARTPRLPARPRPGPLRQARRQEVRPRLAGDARPVAVHG